MDKVLLVSLVLSVTCARDNITLMCYPCLCLDSKLYCEGDEIFNYPQELTNITKQQLKGIFISYTNIVRLPHLVSNEYPLVEIFSEVQNMILECTDVEQWYNILTQAEFESNCILPTRTQSTSVSTSQTDLFTDTTLTTNVTDITSPELDGETTKIAVTQPTTSYHTDDLATTSYVSECSDDSCIGRFGVVLTSLLLLLCFVTMVIAACIYSKYRRGKYKSTMHTHSPIYIDPSEWIEMDQAGDSVA